MTSLTEKLVHAVQNSPDGIAALDTLESLRLCDSFTLRTTLSRLSKSGSIIRLKRGVYSANPISDAFAAAQYIYSGYLGFSSALYVHKLIAELPFAITVVTVYKSASKTKGAYEFRAVALGKKAIGFETIGNIVVSTRAKTLFDCIYMERYSVERNKLIDAYRTTPFSAEELKEFNSYIKRFVNARAHKKFEKIKREIIDRGGNE